MTPALLIGREPGQELGYCYVSEPPYEAVVIGSLSLGQLLRFREERVLEALAQGKQVLLYTPGLPQVPRNRALAGSLASARREEPKCSAQSAPPVRAELVELLAQKILERLG